MVELEAGDAVGEDTSGEGVGLGVKDGVVGAGVTGDGVVGNGGVAIGIGVVGAGVVGDGVIGDGVCSELMTTCSFLKMLEAQKNKRQLCQFFKTKTPNAEPISSRFLETYLKCIESVL